MSFEEKLILSNANHKKICKLIIELIPIDWMHLLKTKTSQTSPLKVFYFNDRGIKNLKISRNFRTNKSTLLFKIITRIIIKRLNLFHGQITLKRILFSAPKTRANFFLAGSKMIRWLYIFDLAQTCSFFPTFIPWNTQNAWGILPPPYVLDVKKEKNLTLILYFTGKYPKLL